MSAISAIRKAIPTSRHAEVLFDSLVTALGQQAALVSANDGQRRTIYRREGASSSWVVPWPLLTLSLGRRGSFVGVPGQISDEVPEESDSSPSRLRNLQGGEIEFFTPTGRFAITYAADGLACETSRSCDEDAEELARALASEGGQALDRLVACLIERDVLAEASGRLWFPERSPVALTTAWRVGLRAMRRMLFDDRRELLGPWIAADGSAGVALGRGELRQDAFASCLSEVERERPAPPTSRTVPELSAEVLAEMGLDRDGLQTISAPTDDRAPGEPIPENTPVAATRLDACPEGPDDSSRAVPLLDDRGRSTWARVADLPDGHLIVGGGLKREIDLDALLGQIDAAISDWRERTGSEPTWPEGLPPLRSRSWSLLLDADGKLRVQGSSASPVFDPGDLDGASINEAILRVQVDDEPR